MYLWGRGARCVGVGDVRTRCVYVGDVPMCVCVCVSM